MRIARTLSDERLPPRIEFEPCGQLVEMNLQLRVKLRRNVILEQSTEPPAGKYQGRSDPDQRTEQQPDAQGRWNHSTHASR